MNELRSIPPRHVPTLTEVVEINEALDAMQQGQPASPQFGPTGLPLPEWRVELHVDPEPAADLAAEPGAAAAEQPLLPEAAPEPMLLAPVQEHSDERAAVLPVRDATVGPAADPARVDEPQTLPDHNALPAFLRAAVARPLAAAAGLHGLQGLPGASASVDRLTRSSLLSAPVTAASAGIEPAVAPVAAAPAEPSASSAPDQAAAIELVTQRVLADMQRQIDLMLEYRLREALAPILARAADAIIKDARKDLTATLKDIVSRAVAQELVRQRQR